MYKILLIEDQKDVREGFARSLRYEGYDVVEAKNGVEGIDIAKKESPDLIICDIMMPGLDGYGVWDAIRADILTIHIPFIFLTAKGEIDDLRKGMNLAVDAYLTKPITLNDLLNSIKTVLNKVRKIRLGEINDIRENIFRSFSHDFNTSLISLKDDYELLMDNIRTEKNLSSEQLNKLANSFLDGFRNISAFERTVQNLLDFAHIELDAFKIETLNCPIEVSVKVDNYFINELINEVSRKFSKNIKIDSKIIDAEVRMCPSCFEIIIELMVERWLTAADPTSIFSLKTNVSSQNSHYVLEFHDYANVFAKHKLSEMRQFDLRDKNLYKNMNELSFSIINRAVELFNGKVIFADNKTTKSIIITLPIIIK